MLFLMVHDRILAMLRIEELYKEHPDFHIFWHLYLGAFPKAERLTKKDILNNEMGHRHLYGFYELDKFVGFTILLETEEVIVIQYFATLPALRSKGYGSQILDSLKSKFPNQILFVEIEQPDDLHPIRTRRRDFYLRNGYSYASLHYGWKGVIYDVYAWNGTLTKEALYSFWMHFVKRLPDNFIWED